MPYRMYIDEVGNHDLESSKNPNERYLNLTGVMVDLNYAADVIQPEMEGLKRRYFNSHPDDPIVLHRKQLAYRRPPFHALQNPATESGFNRDLLYMLTNWNYTVFSVTVDKLQHLQQYHVWRYNPYHYGLKILIERYVQCLERRNAVGDVLAEARNSNVDEKLKTSFTTMYDDGTEYIDVARIQARLTSKQLKVKPKTQNIAGLQLADLIAYPSHKLMLARHNNEAMPDNFNKMIADILVASKYDRVNGKVAGIGYKWLP